ncbi:thioredoxin family protein [Chryseosolibacter indicus]|uniref:Thioredoxin family protein n=1 Tax=Chryseosolibacter indicus TaxID=2782351 RepID=A0ABS5VUE7_9BACT|nr:thioredoxin family protein [Chryseosolibacter indicus]MBT1705047.1 thioredoxin family protein [Chryseosolibacter indicus]
MAATPSVMIPLGTVAADFNLYDIVSEQDLSLQTLRGERATVILFICNHCPYVKLLNNEIVKVANEYKSKGVNFIAISSNDASQYPDDGPEEMKKVAKALSYPFPYLYDETQEVARLYDAACTPDFFVYDKNLKLAYRGQFDDARPKNEVKPTGRDLRKALDLMIKGETVPDNQIPSIGCNIKWKK